MTLGESLLKEPFVLEAGCINMPDRPGLGIELDEQKLAAATFGGGGTCLVPRRKTGALRNEEPAADDAIYFL